MGQVLFALVTARPSKDMLTRYYAAKKDLMNWSISIEAGVTRRSTKEVGHAIVGLSKGVGHSILRLYI